jgi:hypothetical protein
MLVKGNHRTVFCYKAIIAICSCTLVYLVILVAVIPECGYMYLLVNDVYHEDKCHKYVP